MMIIDEYIFSVFTSEEYFKKKYCEYFQPEIKIFLTKEIINKFYSHNYLLGNDEIIEKLKKDVDEDFYEKRRKGENDGYLYQLIRSDKIKEFVFFISQTNVQLEDEVKESIYETNQALVRKRIVQLIEYALFYGSFKIFNYLIKKTKIPNHYSWILAVHSNDIKVFQLFEDYGDHNYNDFRNFLGESIKCFHHQMSYYLLNNYINEKEYSDFPLEYACSNIIFRNAVKFYNYCFFPEDEDDICDQSLFYLCEYDYNTLTKLFLLTKYVYVNDTSIKYQYFKWLFNSNLTFYENIETSNFLSCFLKYLIIHH